MRLTGLEVANGTMLPRWYGFSYYEPHMDSQVAYPIPFNLFVRWGRDFAWFIKRGKKDALAEAYDRGYGDGCRRALERIHKRGVV